MNQPLDPRDHRVQIVVQHPESRRPVLAFVLKLERKSHEQPPPLGRRLAFGAELPAVADPQKALDMLNPGQFSTVAVLAVVAEPLELISSDITQGGRHYVAVARPASDWVYATPNWLERIAAILRRCDRVQDVVML